MEGILFKWTNYYNGNRKVHWEVGSQPLFVPGWQPRYFLLNETGVLSYYKSKELIHEGCKRSCLVLACEVTGNQCLILHSIISHLALFLSTNLVHRNDTLRFDLVIPGEQFLCLRARSQPERQSWLVALGTFKSRGTKSTAAELNDEHRAIPLSESWTLDDPSGWFSPCDDSSD